MLLMMMLAWHVARPSLTLSDDPEDGEVTDAPCAAASSAAAPAGAANTRSARKRAAPATAPRQPAALLSLRGPDDRAAAALVAAAPADAQKRRRAGGGSTEGPRGARGPHVSQENLSRLSAMAVTLREDLRHIGVPEDELSSRCLSFGEDHLPDFPVIKSGVWARLSPDSLTAAVLSILRDKDMPPLDGLWNAMVKGSYYFEKRR